MTDWLRIPSTDVVLRRVCTSIRGARWPFSYIMPDSCTLTQSKGGRAGQHMTVGNGLHCQIA